jgi:competence protein ComEC
MLSFTGCTAKVTQSSNAGNEHNNAANETTQSASTNAINQNVLRVHFLDVGQGASQLLISPSGKTMLIDAGNNDKEQEMLDYMKKYNIKRLDIVIGTPS